MEFLNLLWKLIASYIGFGYVFLIGHLLVIMAVYKSWKRINQETEALKAWSQGEAEERTQKTPSTLILDQFIYESRELGNQGIFVPITDFSDRLDSTLDGMVSELHERTNLFVIVGIAGTLFGVFEFSFLANEALNNGGLQASEKVVALGDSLTTSMSKAFPVGFVGLIATIIAQIWASRPEHKLRAAVGTATKKALQVRTQFYRSQGHLISEAVTRIDSAMKPLENLEKTLKETIEPVVTAFGTRLDQSLTLVKEQFSQLETVAEGLKLTVSGVQEGVSSLKEVTQSLKIILKKAPGIIDNLDKARENQMEALRLFDENIKTHQEHSHKISISLNETIQNLNSLPTQIVAESVGVLKTSLNDNFSQMKDASREIWSQRLGQFATSVETEYYNYVGNIQSEAQKIQASITAVSQIVSTIAQGTQEIIERPIKEIVQNTKRDVLTWMNTDFVNHYSEAQDKVLTLSNQVADTVSKMHTLQGEFDTWLQNAVQARSAISEMHESLLKYLRKSQSNGDSAPTPEALTLLQGHLGQLKDLNVAVSAIQNAIPTSGNGSTPIYIVQLDDIKKELTRVSRLISELSIQMNEKDSGRGIMSKIFRRKK